MKDKQQHGLLGHSDEADVVLRVAAGLGVAHDVDGILLSLESCGQKVSVPHVLAVVHTGGRRGMG